MLYEKSMNCQPVLYHDVADLISDVTIGFFSCPSSAFADFEPGDANNEII